MQQGMKRGGGVLAVIASACGGGGDEADDVAATPNGDVDVVEDATGDGEETSFQLHPSISNFLPGVGAMVFFENPEGVPGQITINPQPDPPGGTSLNINFYRAGDSS